MSVHIRTVKATRYPTVGDWTYSPDQRHLTIEVLDTGNLKYNFLIAVHEFIEATLCTNAGITQEEVDKWDMETFPSMKSDKESGSHPCAPYFRQHMMAEHIERQLAEFLGIGWAGYGRDLEKLELKTSVLGVEMTSKIVEDLPPIPINVKSRGIQD